jgi:hypothetical protein
MSWQFSVAIDHPKLQIDAVFHPEIWQEYNKVSMTNTGFPGMPDWHLRGLRQVIVL